MSTSIDGFVARLSDAQSDYKSKLNVATDLRDSVELHQVTADSEQFATRVLPEILRLLKTVPVSMVAQAPEHQLRYCLLDVLSRLQYSDALRPAAVEILQTVMDIFQVDNEENGFLCMKIVTNLHRAYKGLLVEQVQPFLDIVITIFKNIPRMVDELFNNQPGGQSPMTYAGSPPGSVGVETPGEGANSSAPMFKATASFKVLTECPIIIVLLYSTHKQIASKSLPEFVPYIIDILSIEVKPQAKEHEAAALKGDIFTGVSPAIRHRAAYNDFIVSQIKVMSFLAYALRAFSGLLQKYYNLVPNFVVRLLKDCPPELSSARKELLVSMRHILATDFRTFFISKVDVLLEERVLIGSGLTSYETLRPLAYSTMADLIHHVRNELSISQIWKTVRVYCRNMHDNTLATSFQVMSAKLLLNFMERIIGLPDKQEGRQIMTVILKAFVDRFETLNRTYLELVPGTKANAAKMGKITAKGDDDDEVKKEGDDVDMEDANESETRDPTWTDLMMETPIKLHAEVPNHDVKDARFIFRNLMTFIKTVMFGFKSCNPPPPHPTISLQQWQEAARTCTHDDVALFRRLFREGIIGQQFFALPIVSDNERYDSGPLVPLVSSKDVKDMMEAFATVYIHIDPATFNEIISAELQFLYEAIFDNPALLHIVHLFLGSETTSANFTAALLEFLIKKMPEMGEGEAKKTNVLMRLFRQCFTALNMFPAVNEQVMLPHLTEIIVEALELTSTAKEPFVYFYLLRALFRSIGGGRFESLYQAVLPLLPVVLETLNKRLETTRVPQERDIYVELCLTVPVRLSLLVPHLSYLMRPLVAALNGSPELVSQGLRTLELCVDNLTSNYFDPIIEPVLDEVMQALWKHLKPLPYTHQHSHTTLRILGKLGGRNRAFLTAPTDLESMSAMSQDTSVLLVFDGLGEELPVRVTPAVTQALKILENPLMSAHYRQQAFAMISVVLKQFIDTTPLPENAASIVQACVKAGVYSSFTEAPPLPDGSDRDSVARNMTNELTERLLEAVFFAASVDETREASHELIVNLTEHLTVLELGEFTVEKRRAMRPFSLEDHEGIPYIETRTLLTAIVYALSHFNRHVKDAGLLALRTIYSSGRTLCGETVSVYRYPLLRAVFAKLIHACFEEPFYRKAGACLGLKTIIIELGLPLSWLQARQVEIVRTLFFGIKDVSDDAPSTIREEAAELLYHTIRSCNGPLTDEQITQRPFLPLSSLLAYEVESPNPAVRETAKKALELLAEVVGHPVTAIIKQVTNVFLNPIFGKPLRALPFPMQIGYIDAVSYCLALPDTFLRFNDKFTRLLEEALALVEAEDESLTSSHRMPEYNTQQQLIELRVVCIRLLSLALTTSDHLATENPQMRAKIIGVFFKMLCSNSKKAVDAAHTALGAVLAKSPSRLPKDLLQSGLRPILVNLSDHKRLTLNGLEGLARLLELLTYYFKVEIGKKLLDHFKAWTESERMILVSVRPLESEERVKIGVAILNVFHLLPTTAHIFIPSVIDALVYIEGSVRRIQTSPFRAPIAKFLNRQAPDAFLYFKTKLTDAQYGRLLCDFFDMEETKDLQVYARENIDQLVEVVLSDQPDDTKCISACNLIFCLHRLPGADWIGEQSALAQQLIGLIGELMGATARLSPVSQLHFAIGTAIEELQQFIVAYARASEDHSIVLSLISAVYTAGAEVSWCIQDYLYETVVISHDVELRNTVLKEAFELVLRPSSPLTARTYIMNTIINPVLSVEIKRQGNLLKLFEKASNGNFMDLVSKEVWLALASTGPASTIDKFQLALLEMSVLIIKSSSALVADVRKDAIKFGWSFLRHEDIVSKMSAYVYIATFVSVFDSLPKIVNQIYVVLLKTHQPEAKSLVNQALETLAPVLVARTNSMWAKWPRRILSEDGHNAAQVSNIYTFMAKNPDLFYEYRHQFVPFIVAAIAKLSVAPPNTTATPFDLGLSGLLANWETRAIEELKTSEAKVYTVPTAQREAVVTYLVRYVCALNARVTSTGAGPQILESLDSLLGIWPDAEVRLNFLERALVQSDLSATESLTACLNALEVVRLALKHKPTEYITQNMDQFAGLFAKTLRSPVLEVHETLKPSLEKVLAAIPASELEPEELAVQPVFQIVFNALQEHLGSTLPPPCWVLLAQHAMKLRADSIDSLLSQVIKAFSKSVKEVLEENAVRPQVPPAAAAAAAAAAAVPGSSNPASAAPAAPAAPAQANGAAAAVVPPTAAPEEKEQPITVALLIEMMDLLASRISHLSDQRRFFLSLIAQCIERIPDAGLARHIIQMVRSWVFSRTEPFPTIKEKAAILQKMLAYDSPKDRELAFIYYELIIDVFTDDHLRKTELPARLEQPFLLGTTGRATAGDVQIRQKLLNIFSDSLEENVLKRLLYVFQEQNWEPLADHQWLNQALSLFYGTAVMNHPLRLPATDTFRFAPFSILETNLSPLSDGDVPKEDVDMADAPGDEEEEAGELDAASKERTNPAEPEFAEASDDLVEFLNRRTAFINSASETTVADFILPLTELQCQSKDLVHQVWLDVFPRLYSAVPPKDRQDLIQAIATLMAREHNVRQADLRPNVVQTILEAVAQVEHLPPQLVRYLAGNFDAWYAGLQILESIQALPRTESAKIAETNLDALTELYAQLQENDMFYGLWRTRSKFHVTNAALSYEQCGMWNRAMQMHESAQIKARSGVLPYGEAEYGLWEDHWILCAEKLQHWDILTELAKHEGFNDLLLECGWRVADWISDKEPLQQSVKSLMDVPTPRRQVFETFLCLQGFAQKTDTLQALSKCCDEGIQLALRKWHGLPRRITGAHIPLLHTFQLYVEFMEASQVYTSLASTTGLNLEVKSQELKGVLQAWHERLPNAWDDINIWGDLVTWRQHVFNVINKVYQPLSQPPGPTSTTNSAAFRGHHEIAWIINRFAHVARKQNMPEVCINLLTRIYALPNIEIQEAFLKLREQAKCHCENLNDETTGLEVISNTNLIYFGAAQKSEFFTLKGMALAKLGREDNANEAFASAVQIDVYLPKAWAEWGKFNDKRFKDHPEEAFYGSTAISCYLQAAGLYKNAKARKLLGRILWLISLDDDKGSLAQAFESYRGEVPVWYWVTYIPQLLTSLAHREAKLTRRILIKIAKTFPQALHFHLRTVREEYNILQRQAMAARPNTSQAIGQAVNSPASTPNASTQAGASGNAANSSGSGGTPAPEEPRQPWEYAEEVHSVLKTAYPLMLLSLETLVDQISHRFRSPADEDAYRLIVALLNDGMQYMARWNCQRDAKLPPATEASILRFVEGVVPSHIKAAFERDFVTDKPDLETYVVRLRQWRNRIEAKLDARPDKINLEALSPPLSEFHYQKFEDVEVPGQNLQLTDTNLHFVKIGRFLPGVDIVRGYGICYRRFTLRGHDGSLHPFAVQFPAARHCRREERVTQLFRILNNVMLRRNEARSRHLQFTLPCAVPLSNHIRLVQDDTRYISMYQIYERFCRARGQSRDAPFDYMTEKLRASSDSRLPKPDLVAVKMEILSGIQASLVPNTVMRDFFVDQYCSFEDFWLFRKQFAYQYAGITFMTFMMSINNRFPHKFQINMGSGNIWATEMLPVLPSSKNLPAFNNGEPVAFRLTPNIQTLMGPTTLEGLYAMSVMIIAKGLTEPEFSLDQYLPVFVRDELISWYAQQQRPSVQDSQLRDMVRVNVDAIVKRASSLTQSSQLNIPANQTIIDLISAAVNPRNLAITDSLWMAYF